MTDINMIYTTFMSHNSAWCRYNFEDIIQEYHMDFLCLQCQTFHSCPWGSSLPAPSLVHCPSSHTSEKLNSNKIPIPSEVTCKMTNLKQ